VRAVSLAESGKQIRCDGAGCHASVHAVVALQPILASAPSERHSQQQGWLFVVGQESRSSSASSADKHYCPCCAPEYLRRLER
jgi:hypothetical protein